MHFSQIFNCRFEKQPHKFSFLHISSAQRYQIKLFLQTPLNVLCPTLQLTKMSFDDNTLKLKAQISCIVRSEKMLIQSIQMLTSTFITLATQTHTRSYVSINGLIMLKRSYCVSKSLPLSRTILSFASPADSSNILYNAFFYHTHLNVSESATIQSHGNAKRTSATSKPYYRTLNDVLANTKKLLKQE